MSMACWLQFGAVVIHFRPLTAIFLKAVDRFNPKQTNLIDDSTHVAVTL
jgi:hypothetical protein